MPKNRQHDWATIQNYYNEGHSIRQICEHFGCSNLTVQRARDAGLFIPRGKNQKRSALAATKRAITCGCGAPKGPRARYCSTECYANLTRQAYIERWKLGLETGAEKNMDLKRFLKRFIIEEAGKQCVSCGFSGINPHSGNSILQVDHIDGNPLNHSYTNLRALCPNCHAMTPTYGTLNKGNGKLSKRLAYHRTKTRLVG